MAYGGFKDLAQRTASGKILRDKAFNIAKNPKYDGCQRGLLSTVYKSFDKKSASLTDKSVAGSGVANEPNYQLANDFINQLLENLKKRKVYSRFRNNIWGADLDDMQLIRKFNEGFRFLLCIIDIFSKYAWVIPLKDKKVISIVMLFKKY